MNREELKRIRRTPGDTHMHSGSESKLEGWYVDGKTGEVTPLGVLSYASKNPLKVLAYKIKRKMGRI